MESKEIIIMGLIWTKFLIVIYVAAILLWLMCEMVLFPILRGFSSSPFVGFIVPHSYLQYPTHF